MPIGGGYTLTSSTTTAVPNFYTSEPEGSGWVVRALWKDFTPSTFTVRVVCANVG